MNLVLSSLPADLTLRVASFPISAGALQPLSSAAFSPGGGCNVAISAARFGLAVAVLGEVGGDRAGKIVLEGLAHEGVDTDLLRVSPEGSTSLVVALVDPLGEPGYLYLDGPLGPASLPAPWRAAIERAEALFVGGWSDHAGMSRVALDALETARSAGVRTFFDPGPGNPSVDERWHRDALATAAVVLATEAEIVRVTGESDVARAARAAFREGTEVVLVKRGAAGCTVFTPGETIDVPGFPVPVVDTTGAGDSVAGAVMAGVAAGLEAHDLGLLANATGAAKVRRLGAGSSMPTRIEILDVLGAIDPAPLALAELLAQPSKGASR